MSAPDTNTAGGPCSNSFQIPPVECASWCSDGDGHIEEAFRGDQWCCSETRYITLSLEEVNREDNYFFTTDLGVMAKRGWRQHPCVYLHVNAEGRRGDRHVDTSFELTANEARDLGALLTSTADLIEGRPSRLVTTVLDDVPTSAEALARMKPDSGDTTVLARFTAGEATARVERFDWNDKDGVADTPTLSIKADWEDEGCGLSDLHLEGDVLTSIDDVLLVLRAARQFIADHPLTTSGGLSAGADAHATIGVGR